MEAIDSSGRTSVRADAVVIAAVGGAHATSHLFHLLLPPLFPLLMPEFGLGYTELGLLMTAFFTVSGIGQAVAGFWVDRFGARRVLAVGIGLLGLSGLALALATSYPLLLLAAAIAGAGNAVFHPADFSLLNHKVTPSRLGYAFSVHGLAGNLGYVLGATLSGVALSLGQWRLAGVCAALVALLAMLMLVLVRELREEPRRVTDDGRQAAGRLFAFLGLPVVWLGFLFFFLVTAAFGGLQSFSAPVLGALYGLAPTLAVAALTGYLLGSAGGMVVGGVIASRGHAPDRTVTLALGTAAVIAAILASGLPPAWSVLPLMAGIGLGVGLAGPSRDLLVREAALGAIPGGKASPAFGRVYGFVYSGLDVGLALGPLAFGALLDAGGRWGVLPGVALLQVAAVLTVLAMGRRVR